MSVENEAVSTSTPALLLDGEFITGHVSKPYIQNEKLLGAILTFPDRGETALLHVKQSDNPTDRLSELSLGDSVLVRIMVQQGGLGRRTVWASEKGVEHQLLVKEFETDPAKFKDMDGRVQGVSEFGVFVDLVDGPAKGQRALLKYSSLSSNGRIKLGTYVAFRVGEPVVCDLAEAKLDESSKLLLRLEAARPRKAA